MPLRLSNTPCEERSNRSEQVCLAFLCAFLALFGPVRMLNEYHRLGIETQNIAKLKRSQARHYFCKWSSAIESYKGQLCRGVELTGQSAVPQVLGYMLRQV